MLQFTKGLPDWQATNAVRGRIDWKYALGLELADPEFDYSALCKLPAMKILRRAWVHRFYVEDERVT